MKTIEITCIQCGRQRKVGETRQVCDTCRSLNARVAKGEVRAPDYTEVTVATYKQPMQTVEGGFGYYGAITQTNDGGQIQCHICGYYFGNLGTHVAFKHKMSVRDYKIKYGLRIMDGLLSPTAKLGYQERYNLYARKTSEEFAAMSRLAQAAQKAKGYIAGGDMWTAQTRNEKGMCKEQTMAKIKHIGELMDGMPTEAAFLREYGSGQKDVVKHWFGSWNNALEEAGLVNYHDARKAIRERRISALLDNMVAFFDRENRTPLWSDFKSSDTLPDPKTVLSYFGNMNNARRAAGVPELLYEKGKWLEVAA